MLLEQLGALPAPASGRRILFPSVSIPYASVLIQAIVDFTQWGEELVAFCDGVDGFAWRQDGAGNVICTCEDNN